VNETGTGTLISQHCQAVGFCCHSVSCYRHWVLALRLSFSMRSGFVSRCAQRGKEPYIY
jgi:hypothetical protein